MSSSLTHRNSKFSPFALTLSNGGALSGIKYIPPPSAHQHRPLLVLLHGGGCHAHHFDVDETHTASLAADSLSIPVISINRPCYLKTSALPPTGSFHQETGRWEHEYIFPALWETFGKANGCSSLVLMAHSLATPGIIVAAALHAQDKSPKYPLAGLIMSGWGTAPDIESQKARLGWKPEEMWKNRGTLMLSDASLNCAPEYIRQYLPIQTTTPPPDEAAEVVNGQWETYWRPLAAEIRVPIMYALGEHDWLWLASQEHVRDFEKCFPMCPRFDGSLILGAPHAIEWSHYAQGWYTHCFGFAAEVSTWHGLHIAEKAEMSPRRQGQ